ncbi:MAG: BCD family MFS transporter [Anaerolineales bacterium]
MQRSRLLRLGLFQLAAGSTSVIFLGVVNRVMRVELGLDLLVVSILVGGGHYLGALVAIPFGYYSDTHRLAGYRRSAYALGGAVVTALLLAVSPFVAVWLSTHQTLPGFTLGFLFFLLEGISTFIAGTAYLSLITDLTTESERGPATGVVWTMLMVGIIATGISTGVILSRYTYNAFLTLTLAGAVFALLLALGALLGQEKRAPAGAPAIQRGPGLRASLRVIARSAQTRWFAAFLMLAMFSYFMQDAILEPFGGEVFKLDVAQTARFNSYMGTGVILGMLLGGLALIPRFGKPRITALGCWLMVGAFALLAFASVSLQVHWLSLAITALGFGSGLFTVGGVALMMDMTSTEQTGLFVGAWTLIQALAKGPASIAAGALQTRLVSLGSSPAQAYAGVFIFEAVGVLAAVLILARVGVATFRTEVTSFGALAAEAMD